MTPKSSASHNRITIDRYDESHCSFSGIYIDFNQVTTRPGGTMISVKAVQFPASYSAPENSRQPQVAGKCYIHNKHQTPYYQSPKRK